MFEQELEELHSLSEIDLIGKKYYLETGNYLSRQTVTRSMIKQFVQLGGLLAYMDDSTQYSDNIAELANATLKQESPFFNEESDVSITKSTRYFESFEHSHNYFEIQCVLHGSAEYTGETGTFSMIDGDMILVPANTVHGLRVDGDSTIVNVGIRRSTFEEAFQDILSGSLPISRYFRGALAGRRKDSLIFQGALDPFSLELLLMICNQQKTGTTDSGRISNHLVQSFLYYLADHSTEENIYDASEFSQDKIWEIRAYLSSNYRTVTLSSLASHFHFSESYLSRFISKSFRQSFSQMLQNIRLQKSCELLTNTTLSLSELCEQIGYSNQSYYIKIFHMAYGITPLQYRKRHRKQV